MQIVNILPTSNELMDKGLLNEQIVHDFEKYIKQRENYQGKLNGKPREEQPEHYTEWTANNQKKITYAKRIVHAVTVLQKLPDIIEKLESWKIKGCGVHMRPDILAQNERYDTIIRDLQTLLDTKE